MDERTLKDLIRGARPEVSDEDATEWSFRAIREIQRDRDDMEDPPLPAPPRRSKRRRRRGSEE
jgi:hypothetical protein